MELAIFIGSFIYLFIIIYAIVMLTSIQKNTRISAKASAELLKLMKSEYGAKYNAEDQ